MLLFVYGTLRRGQPLHAHLGAAEFLGRGTVPGRLLDLGAYPGLIPASDALALPGVTPEPAGGERVHGELYRSEDADLLARLDELEDHRPTDPGQGLFLRCRLGVRLEDGRELEAWGYALSPRTREAAPGARVVPGGDWLRARRPGAGR